MRHIFYRLYLDGIYIDQCSYHKYCLQNLRDHIRKIDNPEM